MISKDRITQIFCSIDDFCLVFEPALQKRQITTRVSFFCKCAAKASISTNFSTSRPRSPTSGLTIIGKSTSSFFYGP